MSAPGRRRARVGIAAALLAAYLVALGAVAFWPDHVDRPVESELSRLIDALQSVGVGAASYEHLEFGANVLLFAPFGAVLAILLGRIRLWLAVPICFLVSCGIELAQSALLPGRDGDPRDVVANTLGAIVGAAVVALVGRAVRPARVGRRA